MQNCASFSFIVVFLGGGGLSLKCIHDIFNVTMVSPLVLLVSVMGEHFTKNLSVTVQVPKSVTRCFNVMINNHNNGLSLMMRRTTCNRFGLFASYFAVLLH